MNDIATTAPAETPIVSAPPITTTPEEQTIFHEGDELFLVARYPYQMQACQSAMVEWADRKLAEMTGEIDDLAENVEIARTNKWGTAALIRARNKAMKRREFYEKIKAAIEAGHCIVPNFPVEMIAIRTRNRKPEEKRGTSKFADKIQSSQSLPQGEGEYQNPAPVIYQHTGPGGDGKETTEYYAKEWAEFDFPFHAAKPQILTATARAMADKFFDEIGILPGPRRKGDPIIVGRIIDKSAGGYSARVVTFLIAWFLDTKDL